MIGFFPFPYPDELLYSQLCRYHVRSGNTTYLDSARSLYQGRNVIPDMFFLNRFNSDALYWICESNNDLSEIIETRTMYPSFARFLPIDRRQAAKEALMTMERSWNNILRIPNMGERHHLRYCPVCAKEDRQMFGETYWHRKHQLYHLDVCPFHGCFLENTNVISNKMSPGFYDAESNVPNNTEPREISETQSKFAKYVLDVFDKPVDLDSTYSIGFFLNEHIPEKYKTKSGLVRNINDIYKDLKSAFQDEFMEMQQLQKIFNGYRFDSFNILQVAYWEEISVDDIVKLPEEMTLVGIDALYKSLSLQFDVEAVVVKHIGEEVLKFSRGRRYLQRKSGPREREWAELDEKMFPEVEKLVGEIMNTTGRPIKLTEALVQKSLNLPQKQVSKLPKCHRYIKDHMETYPEFWAREIVWAAQELSQKEIVVSRNKIAKMLSLTGNDVASSLQYIKDPALRQLLQREE